MTTSGLAAALEGRVVRRGDAEYEAVRRAMVWNARTPPRHPDAIAQVASETDIVAAIDYARRHGLKVAVRGGGHSWCGAPLRDGGVLLDLSRLSDIAIDAARRVATIQPVVSNRALAAALAEHDLAFPVGHCGSVPASGYLLSGGFGWNSGAWGVACFNVLAADVVLADGRLVRASADEQADLFWAARGAGAGFFGVVTRFVLQAHALPRAITTSRLTFPLAALPAVVAWTRDTVARLPPSVELTLMLAAAPPQLAASDPQVCMLMATAFADSPTTAAAALDPLAHCPVAPCLARALLLPTPFPALFDLTDPVYPHGRRFAVDTLWSRAAPLDVLSVAAEHFRRAPSRDSVVLSLILPPRPPGGAPVPDAAFSLQAPVYAACYAIWADAAQDAANQAWLRDAMRALEPFGVGHYLGEVDLTADPARARRSFAAANWQRLEALRRQYDPDGVFHAFL